MLKKLTFILLSSLLFAQGVYAEEKVTLKIVGEKWNPYNNYAVDKSKPGFMFEIVDAVLKKSGYAFSYKEVPFARAVSMAKDGSADALIGADKMSAVGLLFPEEAMGFSVSKFYVKKDSKWEFKNLNSLTEIKTGLLNGVSYGDDFDKFFASHQGSFDVISGEDYLSRNFKKLSAGSLGAVLDDGAAIAQFLKESGQLDKFKDGGALPGGLDLYIAFSPKYAKGKEMAELMTNGMRQMRKSGELKTILDKYGVKDWK